MPTLTVGPNSMFPSIASAMASAAPGDTILLEAGYGNETATVSLNGITVSGGASSTGIVLHLGNGIATMTLAGTAPIDVFDAPDGNGIVGNDGDNLITVTAGADSVSGGLGDDRLVIDYRLATGAVTGDSTSNVSEAGGGGRVVTILGGFEDFTILTGSGADTITTGAGDDIIETGEGAGTVNAGQGANTILGGSGSDTITALDGGNVINGGGGTNTLTSGGGADFIRGGRGADTIIAGGGADEVKVLGGADTADSGAGNDTLVVDYSDSTTSVTGGVTSGDLNGGYGGQIADLTVNSVGFLGTENFWITTGSGNDRITTGNGLDLLDGRSGNDTLKSGGGADLLNGGEGRDRLIGGEGDDVLVGGAGGDLMKGGSGLDHFEYDVLEDSGAAGRDSIKGFDADDLIDLTMIDANANRDGNQRFTVKDHFTDSAGELQIQERPNGKFVVSGDVDGDGQADFSVLVKSLVGLTGDDFLL